MSSRSASETACTCCSMATSFRRQRRACRNCCGVWWLDGCTFPGRCRKPRNGLRRVRRRCATRRSPAGSPRATRSIRSAASPTTVLQTLTAAIDAVQPQSHPGTGRCGSSFASDTAANRRSATVSNLAPNELVPPVFLAIAPSEYVAQSAKQVECIERSRERGNECQQNAAQDADSGHSVCKILFHASAISMPFPAKTGATYFRINSILSVTLG